MSSWPRPRGRAALAGAGIVALVLLSACGRSAFRFNSGPVTGGPATSGPAPVIAGGPLSAPRLGRAAAELDVVAGFTSINVSAAAIGSDLFRLQRGGAAAYPVATLTGDTVAITSAGSGSGNEPMQLVLNPDVVWTVVLAGGSSLADIDLSAGRVRAVEITQGVSSIQLSLPAASGTVPMTMSGGASEFQVHRPGTDAVQATMAGGAGTVVIDGVSHSGVAGGTIFTAPGWATAADRLDIDCSAGVSTLIVDQA